MLGVEDEGEGEGVPGLLPLESAPKAADTSSLPGDSEQTLDPVDSVMLLSLGDSLNFSPESRGDFVIIGSTPRSGFELDCNLKSTLNFFKLSICFLWSGGMLGNPLLTGLLLGEDSTGFTFSLLAEGELCRISFASVTGIALMIGAGLAEIGDVAKVGVATESTGTVPACGEDKEEGPGGGPPTMVCRGERGLCPPLTTEDQVPPEGLLRAGGVVEASPDAPCDMNSTPGAPRQEGTLCALGVRWVFGDILGGPPLTTR